MFRSGKSQDRSVSLDETEADSPHGGGGDNCRTPAVHAVALGRSRTKRHLPTRPDARKFCRRGVPLTEILSRSPAGVTRLPKSYGEQVKGEEYEAEEIAALRSQRLRRIAPRNLP